MPEIELRDYQVRVIEEARAAAAAGHRGILLFLTTGAGKTRIALKMMHNAKQRGFRSIYLAHRRELVKQTAERFRSLGVSTTILMDGYTFDPSADLVVASQQTWESRHEWLDREYGLAIFDEAHIGVSRQKRIINDIKEYNPHIVYVGLTATPMTNNGPGLGSIYSYLVHGPTISELTEQGYLVPAEHYVMQPLDFNPRELIKIRGGEYDENEVMKWFVKNHIIGDVVQNWMDHFMGKKTIVFARSIEHSVFIAEEFGKSGIPAAHIDFRTPWRKRSQILQKFKDGEIVVLVNVDIFSEGFDMPDMEVGILATPINSVTRYIQRVGRLLRPSSGKERAIIVDHGGVLQQHGTIYNFQQWELEPARPPRHIPYHAIKVKVERYRSCPICGHTFKAGPKVCPSCGYDFYRLPPGTEPPIIPATMLEYEHAIELEKKGVRVKCRGMAIPLTLTVQDLYDILRHMVFLSGSKEAFADVLFYSVTCRCPKELRLHRTPQHALMEIYGEEPHEFAVRVRKRYFVLNRRGYFREVKCW